MLIPKSARIASGAPSAASAIVRSILGEVALPQHHPRAEATKPLARGRQRMRIAIKAKQRRAARLQQRLGVPAGAERGVNDKAPFTLAQQAAHLTRHYRQMQPIPPPHSIPLPAPSPPTD